MIFSMAISLYTSRIVLEQLGIDDYGVYNVVGGIVTMFSIVSASMTSAIGRFLTYELGTGNKEKLKDIFCNAVSIQLLLSLGVVILIETVGIWFLNNKMNIAPERMVAANWVLQFSTVTFIVNMISVPYNASIISHERMGAFAYISILEVVLKLAVAFLLFLSYFDSLIWYSFLIMMVSILIRMVYNLYCKRNFEECKYNFRIEKGSLKEMIKFSGWNFIGSSSAILRDQGVNIVLNIFCGSAVNAARGIANQVNTAVYGFSSNFMLAMNPQIIKSYASGDREYMQSLIIQGARFSLYLLLFLSLPIILEAPNVLALWLVSVPAHTVGFTRLVLIVTMVESLSIPLMYANQATGKIRNYQLIVGGIQMLNLPFAYLGLKLGFIPEIVYVVSLVLAVIALFARLVILKRSISLPVAHYVRLVLIKGLWISLVSLILPLCLYDLLPDTGWSFITVIFTTLLWCGLTIYVLGCDKQEKEKIRKTISSIKSKIQHSHA